MLTRHCCFDPGPTNVLDFVALMMQLGEEVASIPEPLRRSARFNDGKASPAGAFILGTVHNQAEQGQPGQLFELAGGPSGPFDLIQVCTPPLSMHLVICYPCKDVSAGVGGKRPNADGRQDPGTSEVCLRHPSCCSEL